MAAAAAAVADPLQNVEHYPPEHRAQRPDRHAEEAQADLPVAAVVVSRGAKGIDRWIDR